MCVFPNIDYKIECSSGLQNGDGHGLRGTAKGMYTRLKNLGIVDDRFLEGIENVNYLEKHIFDLIDEYPENDASLEKIFHLIQIWGGSTGAGIYTNQSFDWAEVGPLYKILIDKSRGLNDVSEQSCEELFSAINDYYNGLHCHKHTGMGVAFITKHTRFWMHRNHPNDMLPIYDSTFSEHVMLKGPSASLNDLLPYWEVMIKKAKKEGISLTSLERRIFNYYASRPDSKKGTDYYTHNGQKEQTSDVFLSIYDRGLNTGKTISVKGVSGVKEASAVYVEYNGRRFEAALKTYNSGFNTLRGKSIYHDLILANILRPGQKLECDFCVNDKTHLYIIK